MPAPTSPGEPDELASAAGPPLRVWLFGELDLRVGDEPLPPLESARARSLLIFLLLGSDAPQPRQRLAFLLWPDSTERQARTNLRHLLHTVRGTSPVLDRYIGVTPQTLQWRSDLPCWVDVDAFAAALARGGTAPAGSAERVAALQDAVELYRGDLVEGCYDEWLVEARERYREHYVSALQRLGAVLAERREYAEAIRLYRELLRHDPLQEDAYRLLVRLHSSAGDRAGAVRVYHECVTTMQRELGVEPAAATTEAYAEVMRPEESPASDEREPARVSRAVLVGRGGDWDRLTGCWREAERGRPRLVLVTGEAGVGKTRLAEELASWCAHRGAVVAQARSYPTEGELGFEVMISWLRTAEMTTHLRRATPSDRADLSRLLPELADAPPSVGEGVDEAEQRARLFSVVARILVGSGRPTLLITDDIQWCDAQSLQLIHYLVRLEQSNPLLVVATVRRDELDEAHPVTALAEGLQVVDRATEIALGRLPRAATGELAHHLSGGDIGSQEIDRLYEETEGNPLFIVETLRAGWDAKAGGASTLTPKLQAVIGARLRTLSAPTRELLAMAATVGREFTADVLGGASTMNEPALVRSLDELWRRGIIREQGTDAYDFAHGKIRDVAYDGLSPAERRRNHLLIAEALLRLHAGDVDIISGEVARHYDRSGQAADALTWYQQAAVHAQRLHASVEAVRLLDRAGELVAVLPGGVDRRRHELAVLSALPTPLAAMEGFGSTRLAETQSRVMHLAGTIGVEVEPSLLRSLAMTNLCQNDFDSARTVADHLRASAENAGDDNLRVESEYLSGIAEFWDGAFQPAQEHFEWVVDQFDAQRRPEHLLRFGHDPKVVCVSRLANTLWFLGRADDARRTLDEAMALADEVAHPFSRGVALVFAALLCVDLEDADQYRQFVDALGTDTRHQAVRFTTEAFRGYADVLDGRTAAGIGRIRSTVDTREIDRAPGQRATHLRLLVAAYHVAGDAMGGVAAADEALAAGGSRIWEAEIRRLRARFLTARAAPRAEIESELDLAADVARRQGAVELERRVEQARPKLS